MPFSRATIVCLALVLSVTGHRAAAENPTAIPAEEMAFFENKIRPILVKHCYECHSTESDEVGGGLLLDTRIGMRKGGETGNAIVQGKPSDSRIIQALLYEGIEMPPDERLPENIVKDFTDWIARGAHDPRTPNRNTSTDEPANAVLDRAKDLWSLQPVVDPSVPEVKDANWPLDPIDHFALAKMEAADLQPTDPVSPLHLIRRLSFDLTGLPPTMARTEEFIADCNTNRHEAIATLVDELLASPQYGERWGRHWLDVARYGESNGNDGLGRNPTFPHAWRYRDYVIAAFNADTPYNRFLTEQIAGDLLPADTDEEHDKNRIATGLFAMTAKPAAAMNTNFAMDVVADQIDVIGSGMLGISIACARCHDHKFDPIPTSDYYALAGFFTSSKTMWGVAAHEKLTAGPTGLHVLKAAPKVMPPDGFVETVLVKDSNTGVPRPVPESKWPVGTPLAMGLRDKTEPADCKLNIKGDAKKLGDSVPRAFLTAIESIEHTPEIADKQSGRLELAEWITDDKHPLTARVMVNRIWQHLFGTGIVSTPNDFGIYGEPPSHPELLDHLAARLVSNDWSIKKLIRAIVLSRTYQLSSLPDDALAEADQGAILLTHHRRRRLDAESLRDSILSVSGNLDLTPADGSIIRHRDILINLAGSLHEPTNHRSIYLCYLRSSPPPELAAFDLPDFVTVVGQRDVSIVPNQALHLFNNPFVVEQASRFADLLAGEGSDPEYRIRLAWNRAFCRDPEDEELKEALAMLQSATTHLDSDSKAWASLCQALLATNEFRYVD